MSADSRHLGEIARVGRAGAHLVLRGHLHDEVILNGRIVTERWALTRVLRNRVELDAVLFLDAVNGLHCPEPSARERVEGALRLAPIAHDSVGVPIHPRLGNGTVVDGANAVLALLRQNELAVAVVLDDLDALIDPTNEQGRRAIALLRRGIAEAECIRGRGPLAPRNLLIAVDSPPNALAAELARMPGVRVLQVAPPDRDARALALRRMARGFFGAESGGPAVREGLELLADRMEGCSVHELEQLRRISHERRISPSRPAALLAERTGRVDLNPVARVGVDAIMEALEANVVGQPAALKKLRSLLESARHPSALRSYGSVSTKPLMVMVAFGPAGVGKTETARTLARVLFGSENAYVRIDCGEYQNPHDVARLTGAPPGYVGYDAGGQLSEPLRRGPAVVLFDELEKARHDTIVNLLLAILDDGRLTDGRGDTVTFDQAIVVFTTNLGTKDLQDAYQGGQLPSTSEFLEEADRLVRERISKSENDGMGRPELLSRLRDDLVPYDFVRPDALPALAKKYCSNIAANLGDEFDVELRVDVELFAKVFGERLESGAWDGRAVERLARTYVERPLREQLNEFLGDTGAVIPDSNGFATLFGDARRRRSVR